MQYKHYFLYSFFALLVGIHLLGFKQAEQNPSTLVAEQYQEGINIFLNKIQKLEVTAQNFSSNIATLENLQSDFLQCRADFKKIEFLLEFFDHEAIKDYVNGAPLLSLERNAPEAIILEPEGLQVLDELIFSEKPNEEAEAILDNANKLKNSFRKIASVQKQTRLYDRHIFEATRAELVRIFTLGVTGFDTPGSINALEDAKNSMEGLQKALLTYSTWFEKYKIESGKVLLLQLEEAKQYLQKNTDFDTFDRLTFLKNHINPLYKSIYDVQMGLGVETFEEVSNVLKPINYHATNLFSNDFFNHSYYTNMAESKLEKERIYLGRMLFFDPVLSINNERACASCHQPNKGFTDGQTKSLALNFDGTIDRNAPTVINSIYAERFFYDLRSSFLSTQVEHVIHDKKEFNTSYFQVLSKLKSSEEYKELFQEAFPELRNNPVNKHTVSTAFNSYLESLSGFNSSFDKYVRGESKELSASAKRGFNLFMGKAACGTCHFAPVFNGTVPPNFDDSESEVLGVPATTDTIQPQIDSDLGRYNNGRVLEHVHFYKNSFKTVTVRNIGLTAPYMHNGVYETLEEVVDFYNKGGGAGMGIDVPNQTLPDAPLNLTEMEQKDLVSFMEALTDTTNMTKMPTRLPQYTDSLSLWNERKVGGIY